MNAPAIAALRDEIARITKRIDAIENQPAFPITVTEPALKDGEMFVAIVISADGRRREKLILLPGSFQGTHAECMAWAEAQGGKLPDRVQGALLYAAKASGQLEGEFETEAYWTCEQHAAISNYAWAQWFTSGSQSYSVKLSKLRARAVRSEPIQ